MPNLFELDYVQHFQTLPNTLYTEQPPQGLPDPKLVIHSESTAQLLGLDTKELNEGDALQVLSGNGILSNWRPLAMKYTGHQFGHYNPDLGDGRGLLLSQVKNNDGIWDLHLKGAGITPYSRQGDGRAVLRSSIREFIASEAMAALGIPTTRALSLVHSPMPVYRETEETAAALIRVSNSHIRFGHFEFCSFTNQHDLLKTLADHVIDLHYPDLKTDPSNLQNPLTDLDSENHYVNFYELTLDKTANLIAQWQCVGFNHGVMNTDNMSILGETFDYGPYAFLDDYEPGYICNHSDHQGRYAFNQQPNIGNWNLAVLAQALLPLCDKDSLVNILDSYADRFKHYFLTIMCKKLGFNTQQFDDFQPIIEKTLSLLANNRMDYTLFFRSLSSIHERKTYEELRNNVYDIEKFDEWFMDYEQALELDGQSFQDQQGNILREQAMNKVNPKYILRNYLAQNAIDAAEKGDYQPLRTLHEVLQNPFDDQPEFEDFSKRPPDWGKKMEISCSS